MRRWMVFSLCMAGAKLSEGEMLSSIPTSGKKIIKVSIENICM